MKALDGKKKLTQLADGHLCVIGLIHSFLQHAIERVERPGESQEDGKKTFCGFMVSGELLKQLGAFRERHVATPKSGLPHAPTRGCGAPFFVLPAIKIEIENSLEMALSKAKSGARGNPVFGSLEPCEALYTQIKPQCKQRIHPLLNMYYYSSTG